MAEVAEVITHATPGMTVADGVLDDALIVLVTDGALGSGLDFTGWSRSIVEQLSLSGGSRDETLTKLVNRLEAALISSGQNPALANVLLQRTHLIHRPWHLSAETEKDLEVIYDLSAVSASLAYAIVVGELAERAAQQRLTIPSSPAVFTQGDVDRIIADIRGAIDVPSLEEAYRAGVCEPIDYLNESNMSPEQFFAGVDVSPSHISAGLDVLRVDELEQVLSGLRERNHVVVTGPSGSGKSALLWRAGSIVARGARSIRALRVADDEDVELLVRHVRRERPTETTPLLVCGDDIGRQPMIKWPEALVRLREIPFVYLLSAVRREDFTPSIVGDGVVVEAWLTRTSAEAIYERLADLNIPLALEVEEAVAEAKGLLMEYLALITTGRRLRDVLSEQVSRLRVPERFLQRGVLRLVSAAHTVGTSVGARELGMHFIDEAEGDLASVGDALNVLEGEHLILHDALGHWRGLHDLRTEILQEVLHASPPPTLGQTFSEVLPLLSASDRPLAIRRAAEQLCRAYGVFGHSDSPMARLADLVELLTPIASAARDLLQTVQAETEGASSAATLLEAGERLDSVAYVYGLLPWLEANRAPSIDVATLAGLLYTIRMDGLRMPDFGGGPRLNELGESLPPRPTALAETVAKGLSPDQLTDFARSAPLESAIRLLESAEDLLDLTQEQARNIWEHHVPSLPSPPGAGFDLIGAEFRARLAAVLAELAVLKGSVMSDVLGPTVDRAIDAIASDDYGISVTLAFESSKDEEEDDWVPAIARKETWSTTERLIADARLFTGRSDTDWVSSYRPQPGATPGPEEDARRACQRLLDACPEVDRADVKALAPNGDLPAAGGHAFGSKSIRAGVLRVGVSMRRNVAFQAAVARALAGRTWSARLRDQTGIAAEISSLLTELPRRFRAFDNPRRRREWQARSHAVEQRVAELPSRPLEPQLPTAAALTDSGLADAREADETARRKDLSKDALALIASSLTQVATGLEPFNPHTLFGAGARLREAPDRLSEARADGAPVFSTLGETLPAKLDQEAMRASTLLLAVGSDEDIRIQVEKSKSDDETNDVVEQAIHQEANADKQLLAGRLESAGIPVSQIMALPDPRPLLGRLDGGRTLALVPVLSWEECASNLQSWTQEERRGAKGHLLVAAVDGEDLLPIAVQITADTGDSPLPVVDEADFIQMALETGRHLRRGEVGTLVGEAIAHLVEWSFSVTRRATRDSSWAEPPLPPQTPSDIKSGLIAAKNGLPASHGPVAGTAIEALCDLADLVADEDGTGGGLAADLAEVTAGRDTDAPDILLMNVAVGASLEADRYKTKSSNEVR